MTHGSAIVNLGAAMVRGGMGLFTLGLAAGFALILQYFYLTPSAICWAVSANGSLNGAWPWAFSLLGTEGFALALVMFGIFCVAYTRPNAPMRSRLLNRRNP